MIFIMPAPPPPILLLIQPLKPSVCLRLTPLNVVVKPYRGLMLVQIPVQLLEKRKKLVKSWCREAVEKLKRNERILCRTTIRFFISQLIYLLCTNFFRIGDIRNTQSQQWHEYMSLQTLVLNLNQVWLLLVASSWWIMHYLCWEWLFSF